MDILAAASGYAQLRLLQSITAGQTISEVAASSNDRRQQLIASMQFVLFIVTAICFLVWLHRAYRNLEIFGQTSETFSPGWAVGYWFIPFVNLVRPYQIVKELWIKSGPLINPLMESDSPNLILLWWAVWIGSGLLSRVVSATGATQSVDQLIGTTKLLIFSDGVGILSAMLALAVVRAIDQRQEESHARPA